jgi:hypothetical protein
LHGLFFTKLLSGKLLHFRHAMQPEFIGKNDLNWVSGSEIAWELLGNCLEHLCQHFGVQKAGQAGVRSVAEGSSPKKR